MDDVLLQIQNLKKNFTTPLGKNISILKSVSFELKKGEIYAFLGINGAGKTTTIQTLLGLHDQDGGQVRFDGKILSKNDLKKIGYAPDATGYYSLFTGREHCILIGQLHGYHRKECEHKAHEVLESLGLLFARDKYVHTYSRGMKQRLGIALSLIGNPELYIWDEPMNGLDPLGRILVRDVMKSLQKKGKSILFSTHILSDVEEVADTFCILHEGKIAYQGSVRDHQGTLEEQFINVVGNQERIL